MAKDKIIYVCKECGSHAPKWMGKCSDCGAWNSYEEKLVKATSAKQNTLNSLVAATKPTKLKAVLQSNSDRIITGVSEFDRVMGGGIVRDSVTIISAPPGAGKSTLLLQLANSLSLKEYKILYASGEESKSQIKNRADRTVKEIADNFWVVSDTKLDEIIQHIETVDADLIILDSIQTFTLDEYSSSRAGSPTQVIECATALKNIAKNPDRPRAVFLVGQMTKADEMAGPRILEHLVDTVLYLEGEDGEELKHLVSKKNRFGNTEESGMFRLSDVGMEEITDPSEFFMTKRDELVPGSALAVIKDGTRPIVIEIESLVSKSFTPYPSRLSECFARKEQLGTLISILEERGGIGLYDKNVIIKATGGLKLTETSVNLAVVMSIASSSLNHGIATDTVFIGELGLTGELKKVPSLEQRLKEVDRMGFKKAYIPQNCLKAGVKFKNLKIIPCKKLTDVITKEFK
ncbi:DNA repair protein RadA [Clostridium estertheticum]|uniref:DNA repair protein RadA n=1 Tax=Clostridium estertheticum subsp. estertheticum TaxID=1552 RepID=A0A1J0GJA6_9CLOT|nr:DNA repair protein RadA [Clostridium estertheticum]APC41444.1 DNA repair protein RadA [Clostridium estertheticum subsp. estertheticum]MBU3072869.1 DNA repair protein RadA [Clostridium estertheticum]MBU3163094.1 DNA repair protein RadA [Clostridium estertheticum]MBU3172667.1 DNA repair protein RadA [Clostridium estertheticum]MBU3183828.1 DNA repair protein RadA [Clostridium estertheticum]